MKGNHLHFHKKKKGDAEATKPTNQPNRFRLRNRPTPAVERRAEPPGGRVAGEREKARNFIGQARERKKKKTAANHGGGAIWYAPHHRRACRCPGLRSRASLLRRPAPPRTCPGRGTVARRDPGRLPSERTRHVGSSHPLSPTAGYEARRTSWRRSAKESPPGRAGEQGKKEGKRGGWRWNRGRRKRAGIRACGSSAAQWGWADEGYRQ